MRLEAMIYEVPPSAYAQRFFSREAHYSSVDWKSLLSIVGAYRQRIDDWYISPAKELSKNIHFAFAVMAIDCLLIDTLSQYRSGRTTSDRKTFKRFIRDQLPADYSVRLITPICHDDGKVRATLTDVADVIYHGFRCGILHQAHMPPYCGVIPDGQRVIADASGFVVYKKTGGPCPSVIINPLALLTDLDCLFQRYLDDLQKPDQRYDDLRARFKTTFSRCFGIDISAAGL